MAPFTPVFHTQDNGAIAMFANTVETCPASASGCSAARTGVATGGNLNLLNNNNYTMGFVNVDPGSGRDNSSSVNVVLPAGSTILFAGLYWAGRQFAGTGGADATHPLNTMLLKGPGQSSYQTITASTTIQIAKNVDATGPYQSFADVTSIVSAAGPGTWFGANVAAATGADRYGGWSLVVAYRNPGLPLRDLTVFNGFDSIGGSNTDSVPISGFLAPLTGPVRTTLGVIAYEGDAGITGDSLKLGNTTLTDALHATNNFFASVIATLGVNNTARNPSDVDNFGFDASLVDATGAIPNGATSTTATFSTSGDQYYPGVLTISTDLFAPTFPPAPKTVVDLNGNNPAQVGDKLEYTIDETNTGLDPAVSTQIQDQLPPNTTYVPNSLVVLKGAGTGPKTDAPGDDTAEFNSATRTAAFRVGTGATATQGGTLNPGDETAVRFDVTVNAAAAGTTINNAATLLYTAKTLGKAFTQATNVVSTPVANQADLSITKTAANPTPTAGGTESYTLTVNNAGPSPAVSTAVTDTLPAGTTLVSATPSVGSCSPGAAQVSCSLGTLAVLSTATVTVTVTLASGLAFGPLTDLAQVSSATPDPNLANNTDTATVQVATSADVSITKTVQTSPVVPGSPVTYLLTATNAGPSDAANVVVTDEPDNNLTVTSTAPSTGSCTVNGGDPVCSLGTLAAGTSATVAVTALVAPSVTGPVTNSALVSTTTPDPNAANDQATVTSPTSPQADLMVTKTVSPNPIVPGSQAAYSLVITNNGPSDATAVVLTDTPPAGEDLVSFAATQGDCSSPLSPLLCQLGNIPVGATAEVDVTADMDASATGSLTNTATVSSATADPNSTNNTAALTAPLAPSADLDIDKAGTVPVAPGGANNYTLTVSNNGPSTATQLGITDPLPADLSGVTASSTGGPCTVAAGTVTCTAAQLAVDATDIVTISATLASSHTGNLVNTASVTAATADPDPTNNSATFTSGTGPQADLSLTKTASTTTVTAGGTTTYTLTATNNGPSDATGVAISDNLPAGVTLASAPGCTLAGAVLTCPVGALAAGTQAVQMVEVTIDPNFAATTLTNTASVTSTTPDPSSDNNSDSVTQDVLKSADLSVLKTGPPSVTAGGVATFTFTVHNAGPSDAQDAFIADTIAPGATVVSVTGASSCQVGSRVGGCELGTMAAGATDVITADVAFDPGLAGTRADTAEVGSLTPDPNPANDTSSLSTTVTTSADVSITKAANPTPLTAGGPATYVLTVRNAGPSDAQDVIVSDPIPSGITVVDSSATGGSCSLVNGTATCNLGTVPAGATFAITADVLVDPNTTGSIVNTAMVTSSTTDPDMTNNSATTDTPVVQSADVSVQKTASPEPVAAGGAISWTLVVVNSGPSTATGVSVTDPLPAGTTFASASSGCTGNATVNCTVGTLAPGDSVTLVIGATTASSLTSGSSIANTATVTSSTADPDTTNNTATATSTITTSADVGVAKSAESAQATAGGPLIYDMRVTNDGPSDAQGVSLTDGLPTGTTFVSAVVETGTCSGSAGALSCAFGTLPAGQETNVKLTVLLDPGLADQSVLTNAATVASTTADANTANNTGSATTIVVRSNDLVLTKTADTVPAIAGSPLDYTLTVANNGPSDSDGSTITDPLPPGETYLSSNPSTACTNVTGSIAPPAPGDHNPAPVPGVTCAVGPLAVGAQTSVTITVLVGSTTATGSTLANTATVTGVDEDSDPADSTATATTPVNPATTPVNPAPAPVTAALTLTKSASPVTASGYMVGQVITYSFVVTNSSNVTLTNVGVDDASFTGTGAMSAVSCPATALAPAAQMTCTATYTLTQADIYAGQLSNTATATATAPGGNAVTSPPSSVRIPEPSDPALTVVKTASPSTVSEAGQTVTYRFLVTNTGNESLGEVSVNDTHFSGTGRLSAISCPSASLAPGEFETCTASYTFTQADTGSASISNSATATGAPPSGPLVTSSTSTVRVAVASKAPAPPPIGPPAPGRTTTTAGAGYRLVGSDGGVFDFETRFHGSCELNGSRCKKLDRDVDGIASTPDGRGYWLVARDGGVFAFGDARFYGSCEQSTHPCGTLTSPVVALAPSLDGKGYWLAAADGAVYRFGDAASDGSCTSPGHPCGQPASSVVGIAPSARGGYWLATANGDVISFGNGAPVLGTCPAKRSRCDRLDAGIVGIDSTPGGRGYWLVAADGGVFAFGNAHFYGNTRTANVESQLQGPIVGMTKTPDGKGYWLAASDGGVFAFGEARFWGNTRTARVEDRLVGRVMGIAYSPEP